MDAYQLLSRVIAFETQFVSGSGPVTVDAVSNQKETDGTYTVTFTPQSAHDQVFVSDSTTST